MAVAIHEEALKLRNDPVTAKVIATVDEHGVQRRTVPRRDEALKEVRLWLRNIWLS